MKKYGLQIGCLVLCLVLLLCGCRGNESGDDSAATTTTTTTTATTTTRTTGTPTTIYAAADTGLSISSPTGERPDAELLERLAAVCKKYKGSVSVYYKDLETGYEITYDADKIYQAASVIKAPYVKYLLTQDIDWNKKLEMTSKQGGSAHVDSKPIGTQFTVGELMEYAIRYSDNTAYYMLNKEFGFTGFNSYADGLTVDANRRSNLTLKFSKPRFGYLSARDVGKYFTDIAAYIDEGSENARKLYSWLITTTEQAQLPAAYDAKQYQFEQLKSADKLNAAYNDRRNGYAIAHKYGEQDYGNAWSRAYHDGAIVWRDHPYVLSICTSLVPGEDESLEFFHDVAMYIDQIQTDWYR